MLSALPVAIGMAAVVSPAAHVAADETDPQVAAFAAGAASADFAVTAASTTTLREATAGQPHRSATALHRARHTQILRCTCIPNDRTAMARMDGELVDAHLERIRNGNKCVGKTPQLHAS